MSRAPSSVRIEGRIVGPIGAPWKGSALARRSHPDLRSAEAHLWELR